MKGNQNVQVKDNIIVQYGGGSMMKPGSYDRYTPFKNNPEADFLVIACLRNDEHHHNAR